MTFIELKDECKAKESEYRKIYQIKAGSAILNDIHNYADKYPDDLIFVHDKYVYKNNIILRVYDGFLDIEDRRGLAIWLVF